MTEDALRQIVLQSTSFSQVIKKLGKNYRSGGLWKSVKRQVESFNIDYSHFTGKHKVLPGPRKHHTAILVFCENRTSREHSWLLRRAMLESGIHHACSCCGLGPAWNGSPLVLDIDHEDGNWRNNQKDNLRFLCPNCHAQQQTSGRRSLKVEQKQEWPANLKELSETVPVTSIANMVGVSETAVRRRMKKMGIKTKPQGYWSKARILVWDEHAVTRR